MENKCGLAPSKIVAKFLINNKSGCVRTLPGVFIGKMKPWPTVINETKFIPRKTKHSK